MSHMTYLEKIKRQQEHIYYQGYGMGNYLEVKDNVAPVNVP